MSGFVVFLISFLTNHALLHESLWDRGISERIFERDIFRQRIFFLCCSITSFYIDAIYPSTNSSVNEVTSLTIWLRWRNMHCIISAVWLTRSELASRASMSPSGLSSGIEIRWYLVIKLNVFAHIESNCIEIESNHFYGTFTRIGWRFFMITGWRCWSFSSLMPTYQWLSVFIQPCWFVLVILHDNVRVSIGV
jgi:hypothetical protein